MSETRAKTAIHIRTATPSDHPFIYNSWLKYFKNNSYFARRIKSAIFFEWHHSAIERILARQTSLALIACDPENEDVIHGYLVIERGEKPVIHWVFVKEAFRRLGIASALIEASGVTFPNAYFTHWTSPPVGGASRGEVFCMNQISEKYPELIYDPYRL